MKIIAIENEVKRLGPGAYQPYLKDEARILWDLYQTGTVRELYFRQDRPEAVLILESESVETAGEILKTLPLVGAGLIDFELIPLRPYPGFSRLFS